MFGVGQTAFNLTAGSASLDAYANNITDGTASGNNYTAISVTGSPSIDVGQNWWGSHSTPPAGIPSGDWDKRLGAMVASWADGINSASLSGAGLSGGTGTAVIVQFPDPAAVSDAPFGVGVNGYYNDMCSPYYDFFVRNASGTFTVTVPVDSNSGCDNNVLDPGKLFYIPSASNCDAPDNGDCWQLITATTVTPTLQLSNLTPSDLGGTHFVAGSQAEGADPTIVSLQSFQAKDNQTIFLLIALFGLLLGATAVFIKKQRTA